MRHIGSATSLPAPPPPRGGRGRRLTHWLAPVLAPAVVVAALGCREEAGSPTAPEPGPALDIGAAQVLSFRQVSAGSSHTCGVTPDNLAYCWGLNQSGQLGNGTDTGPETCSPSDFPCSTRPVAVAGGLRFRLVTAGGEHTCGVTTNDQAYCWGAAGSIGDGTTNPSLTPVAVAGGLQFSQVAAGFSHTCGATPDSRAYCWGSNYFGQLGDGTTDDHLTPFAVAGGLQFSRVDAGERHNCARIPNDNVYCWGSNDGGQLGNGTRGPERCNLQRCSTRPVRVLGLRFRLRQVSGGGFHSCGLRANLAYCWGSNGAGQLGDGTTTRRLEPVAVADGRRFREVSAGGGHTCAVNPLDVAFCWGDNGGGQLGDNTNTQRLTPVRVVRGLRFRQVSTGGQHTCGVTTGNLAYCWGVNNVGQVGDGTHIIQRRRPTPVAGPI
jgi:alpha-tubulin suppressor-like RCC1 family protein